MPETVKTFDGWYALHDFRTIDWEKWQEASSKEQEEALAEFNQLKEEWQHTKDEKKGSHTIYSVIGQKADILFFFLRPEMKDLNALEIEWNRTKLARFTKPAYSYLSVIEKSTYTQRETNPYEDPKMRAKLYPEIPKEEYICFYPMSKLRGEKDNWFQLSKVERGRMMFDHIHTAKPFTKDVKRIVTGSIAFDEHEWGVSLFAKDPIKFKKLIYDTRFDEVSAKYAIFGDFYIGHYLENGDVGSLFELNS